MSVLPPKIAPHRRSAGRIVAAWRNGDSQASEMVRSALADAHIAVGAFNPISMLMATEATTAAKRLDALSRLEREARTGPLCAVPVLIKDLFDVPGHVTSGCSRAYADNVASGEAAVVRRLRASGAILIGKTNQHELAAGGTGLVSAIGPTLNPWDPRRIAGGSSSGSAAAVAAGVVPIALGTDTGGSTRTPAALCGVYGLKLTTGALPMAGAQPLAPSMDSLGVMARSADDTWLALAGLGVCPPLRPHACGRYRLGILSGFFHDGVLPDVLAAHRRFVAQLREAGHHAEAAECPRLDDAPQVWADLCFREFWLSHRDWRSWVVAPSSQVVEWLEAGEQVGDQRCRLAAARRREITEAMANLVHEYDALVVPSCRDIAPTIEVASRSELPDAAAESRGPGWSAGVANLAGLPALSLPVAWSTRHDLPIGMTLMGRAGSEQTLVSIARSWEAASTYQPTVADPAGRTGR